MGQPSDMAAEAGDCVEVRRLGLTRSLRRHRHVRLPHACAAGACSAEWLGVIRSLGDDWSPNGSWPSPLAIVQKRLCSRLLDSNIGGLRMATTSLSLGPHWEGFIRDQIESGRFASASEVVRAALRELEDQSSKRDALKAHLQQGIDQAERGDVLEDATADSLASDALERAAKRA